MKIWDPAYDPYSSLLDQKCMFCRRGSTPDLNPIRQQRSETPVMATPPPAEFFRQKDVTHEYCGITTNSPSPNQCSVRQIISGARAHDKQSSETLCLTLLIF
ncbi:hypothetical protein J6590_071556 [Homalodisca vitripennis]|nr:hypothetical protein J6590_071556 [Homalodisca vitripennis]